MNLSRPLSPSFGSRAVAFIAITALYYVAGWFGIHLSSVPFATPVWIPSGIAVGSLILFGRGMAPAIFLGMLLVNFLSGTPTPVIFLMALGSILEALVGSELVLWICRQTYLKNYFEFFAITFSAVIASAVGATIGVSSLYFFNLVTPDTYSYTWYTWWSGDVIGIFLILPLMMEVYLSRKDQLSFSWVKLGFSVFLTGLMFYVTALVFLEDYNQAFSWILSPLFILAGIKLGRLASRTILIFISLTVVYFTATGRGPFEHGSLNLNLIYVQCLLFSYAFAVLFVRPFESDFRVGPKFLVGNLIGWSCIFVLIYMTTSYEREHMKNDLGRNITMALDSILKAGQRYDVLLHSNEALIKNTKNLTQERWANYVNSLPFPEQLGTLFGLSYIQVVQQNERKKFEEDIRRRGNPDFKIKLLNPEYSQRFRDHFVITFLAPVTFSTPTAGLDIGSEKNRREAAWRSRRLRETIATEPIQMIRKGERLIGFTLLHPIWNNRHEFLGWTGAPVISEDFFSRALEPFSHVLRTKVTFGSKEIYQMDKSPQTPMKKNDFHIQKDLSLFGTKYSFEFYPTPEFFALTSGTLTALSLLMSLFMLFIAGFLLEQITFAQEIEALVNERTKELEVSKVQLIHSSKMASLGEMASGMAHEINNPLTIIQGKISVIRIMLEDLKIDQPALFEEIFKIRQTTDRIGNIVKGLRTFSRSSNQDPFEIVPLDKIIQETLDLCSERFRASGIELKIDPVPKTSIICRPGQISQVLLNLFNNAHDAVEKLVPKWIHLSYSLKGHDRILILVTDSGPGIEPIIAEKIMEPFFTTKDVRRGTGLGLSIVKGIVENHGGQFWLDSDYPHTRFVVELRREDSPLA